MAQRVSCKHCRAAWLHAVVTCSTSIEKQSLHAVRPLRSKLPSSTAEQLGFTAVHAVTIFPLCCCYFKITGEVTFDRWEAAPLGFASTSHARHTPVMMVSSSNANSASTLSGWPGNLRQQPTNRRQRHACSGWSDSSTSAVRTPAFCSWPFAAGLLQLAFAAPFAAGLLQLAFCSWPFAAGLLQRTRRPFARSKHSARACKPGSRLGRLPV
eukprot:352480-Chlamydomonas_euryale.AAC.3